MTTGFPQKLFALLHPYRWLPATNARAVRIVDAPVVRDCKSGDARERQNSTVGDSSRAAHLIAVRVLFVSYVSASTFGLPPLASKWWKRA